MENPRDAEGSATTTLCRGGCGFYGSSAQEGLCSKCFKDALKKKQDPNPGGLASPAPVTATAAPSASSTQSPHPPSAPIAVPNAASISSPGSSASLAAASPASSSGVGTPSDPAPPHLPAVASCPQLGQAAPLPKKTRCFSCRKKVGLTGFDCRCGGVFCALHRYSDTHNCSFDYKALGEEEIRKANPVVAAQKIQKL